MSIAICLANYSAVNSMDSLLSEHASPLAIVGGVDAGGQNIYVDEVAPAPPLAVIFHALRLEHQGAADAFPAERIDVEAHSRAAAASGLGT